MRSFALLAVAAVVPQAMAHYVFPTLIVNGEQTERYQYVREAKNSNSPVTDVTSDGIVCNIGGNDDDVLAKTETKAVNAGDEVGFIVENDMGHPGPLAVYLSKAPSGVASYKGDGDWFKVYELSTSNITEAGLQWATYVNNAGIHNFTFTLPKEVPTGEYLMRAEHIGLHGAGTKGGAQFYIACAQISVTGTSTETPSPVVKFPGVYTGEEPGLLINIYYPAPQNYTVPGGPVAFSGCEDHTANLLGQTSDGDCTGSDGATPTTPTTPTTPSTSAAPSAGIPDYNGGNSTSPAEPSAAPTAAAGEGDDCEKSAARRRVRSMRRKLARAASF
ncbi:glycosyl hydrolase family 61 [Colletotrichum salicis]|uniref:lytic cellulose monooxygenase (C4-dehydrogenating) n=1 Tax=Colletotrichum salicis TaxID=1209931 RepID=A0A135S3G0_9PEZI|nr:glycosyl hydrolase family 61 [Colletotrichum salicis]